MRFSMTVMRMNRELGRDLDSAWQSCGAHGCSMGMRPAYFEFAALPDVSSQSHRRAACSPLEYCRSPHRQTETGPLAGPGFFLGCSWRAIDSEIDSRTVKSGAGFFGIFRPAETPNDEGDPRLTKIILAPDGGVPSGTAARRPAAA